MDVMAGAAATVKTVDEAERWTAAKPTEPSDQLLGCLSPDWLGENPFQSGLNHHVILFPVLFFKPASNFHY